METLTTLWTIIPDAGGKSAALCAIILFVVRALMRHSSAARRHLVCAGTLITCLLLPILSVMLPQWGVLPHWPALEPAPAVATGTASARPLAAEAVTPLAPVEPLPAAVAAETHPLPAFTAWYTQLTWSQWLTLGWLVGAAIFLLPIALGQFAVVRIRRSARPLGDHGACTSCFCSMPMACGMFRPAIILPEAARSWSAERLGAVIRHEAEHLRRADCLWQQLGQLARAFYWFNPLIWMVNHRMLCEAERACDDAVVTGGSKASDYAEHLLAIATTGRSDRLLAAAAIAMARPNSLEGRLISILDAARSRQRVTLAITAMTTVAIAAIALPLASLRAQSPTPSASPATQASATTDLLPSSQRPSAFPVALDLRSTTPPITNNDRKPETPRGMTGTITVTTTAGTFMGGAYLEFWTPVGVDGQQPSVSRQRADELVARCQKVGPSELKPLEHPMLWKEIPEAIANESPGLIYANFSDRKFVLVSNVPEHRMCQYHTDQTTGMWRVTSTQKTHDDLGRPAISFTFDDAGARRFGEFTASHLRQLVAATVNNKVVSLATIQGRIERSGILTSAAMTEEAADQLVFALRNPPRSTLPAGVILAVAPATAPPTKDTTAQVIVALPPAPGDQQSIELQIASGRPREIPVVSIAEGARPAFTWQLPASPKVDYLGIFIAQVDRPDVLNMPQQKLWQAMNNIDEMPWVVLGMPATIQSIEYGTEPKASDLVTHPARDLAEGFYMVMLSGYVGRFKPEEGRQPAVRGLCVLKVGNPKEPEKPDYSKLTPDQMQTKAQEWVEDFFSGNFRDITARKTLEWGKIQKLENGNWQIRYKYEAEIGRKDKIIQDKFFTFTPEGGFAEVKDATPAAPVPAAKPVTQADRAKADELAKEGWTLWQQQQFAPAADRFAEAVELNPKAANAWNGLGWALFNSGRSEDAHEAFSKCVALSPNHPAALNGLGQIELLRGDLAVAEKHLLAASRTADAAWWGLAKLYLVQGKYDEAGKWIDRILKLAPGNDEARQLKLAAQEKRLPQDLEALKAAADGRAD